MLISANEPLKLPLAVEEAKESKTQTEEGSFLSLDQPVAASGTGSGSGTGRILTIKVEGLEALGERLTYMARHNPLTFYLESLSLPETTSTADTILKATIAKIYQDYEQELRTIQRALPINEDYEDELVKVIVNES